MDELISNEGNGMIKIVTGIRRCGKSFLLFTLYKQNLLERGVPSDHIIEMNLENRRNKKWRNPDNLLEYIDSKIPEKIRQISSTRETDILEEKYFVLLDEIQLVPEFEDVLNSYVSMSKVDVFVTGSNAKNARPRKGRTGAGITSEYQRCFQKDYHCRRLQHSTLQQ